ncbi:hypothetical protein CDD83_2118 [Cordyceps sp. RAO-2017]|nr:hypothetical protein CDD83_2118 [Cordyceps sp. RAO-2017]
MTSSKSFRASVLPSSLSLSSLLSSNPDSDKRSRKTLQRRPSLSSPKHQPPPTPPTPPTPSSQKQQQQRHRHQPDARPLAADEPPLAGEPVPPPNRLRRKSKIWTARVSSIFPPLMSFTTDPPPPPPPTQLIARKPAPPIMSPLEPHPLPPLPHEIRDADAAAPTSPLHGLPARAEDPDSQSAHTSSPTGLSLQHSSTAPSLQRLDGRGVSVSSFEASSAATSPESRPAVLLKQEPAANMGIQRIMHVDDGDVTRRQTKLQKGLLQSRRRSKSLHQQAPPADQAPDPITMPASPHADLRGRRSFSAQTPAIVADAPGLQITPPPPPPPSARPRSSKGNSQSPSRGRLRRSWFPGGGRSRSSSVDPAKANKSYAWIMSDEAAQAEYNTSFLKNGEKVPELWNENGDVYVYLYPRGSGCAPSFKVPEFTVSSSYVFNELMQSALEDIPHSQDHAGSFGRRDSFGDSDGARTSSPPASPPSPASPVCMRLYLPTAPPTATGHLTAPGEGSDAELDRLVAVRNLFAFLTGQPLVGTKSRPTTFDAFLEIADLLQEFSFSGIGEDSFGDAVNLSFGFYSDQLGFADCRHSREKTLEALILGERMRCLDLYNEAFAHAAGKYSAIMDLRLPLFQQVSLHTRERLERAHLDLVNRQHNVNEHLEQFEFPSLFAGIANSSSFPELRHVRFKVWRNSFHKVRQFTLNYYKHAFGSWPPKASSKKNPFAESGLNRLVLRVLYSDMCALYDLLVDRTKLTSRVIDEVPAISDAPDKMATSALRNILSEFDRSKPPVLPPIPFDLPQLPSMTAIHETFNSLSAKDQNRLEKKIKEHEMLLILNKAYNYDANGTKTPFLDQFRQFEVREARGKVCQDLMDQRIGYWIFLYVVLQSLPMLVVDAPDLKYTEGVEYFLCQPPMGSPPWVEDKQVRKMWYEVTGGGGRLVELSADAVMFSVEATYHRSHCWMAAQQWEGAEGADAAPPAEPALSPLQPPRAVFPGSGDDFVPQSPQGSTSSTPSPPPGFGQSSLRPRTLSPGLGRSSQAWRSSIAIGLEPVPMQPAGMLDSHNRSSSLGPRPMSSHMGIRSISTGNLATLSRSTTPVTQAPATSGATFDDILGSAPTPTSKKKSRFF